jgi:hypothetical protein
MLLFMTFIYGSLVILFLQNLPFGNLTPINVSYGGTPLTFGNTYNWKVIAKRSDCSAESATQTFKILSLPDLVVDSIDAPLTATSESDIEISWFTKNKGQGSTGTGEWYESAYLSDSVSNYFIGNVKNFSALAPDTSYQSPKLHYHIPVRFQGSYHVIVQTNTTRSIKEVTDTNNTRVSRVVNISLAPPPDLQVTNLVTSPEKDLFSEDSITVTYTIANKGTGPTNASNWTDVVFLSATTPFDINKSTVLGSFARNQKLQKDEGYIVNSRFKMPAYIQGDYYVYVFTDRYDQIFEASREDNNVVQSSILNVHLKSYANLIVSSGFVQEDTITNRQTISIGWIVRNDGAANANPSWTDGVYISSDTIFSPVTDILVGRLAQTDTLSSLSAKSSSLKISIPSNLAEGKYYFFVRADNNNNIFEGDSENDNVSPYFGPVYLSRPDLAITQLVANSSAKATQPLSLSWSVINNATVGLYNANWTDKIYLSTDNILNTNNDQLLATVNNSQFISARGNYNKVQTATIPRGTSGNYYLFIQTDADNSIAETNEANNAFSIPVYIDSAQYPDVQITSVSTPATDSIGTLMSINYKVTNKGDAAITEVL